MANSNDDAGQMHDDETPSAILKNLKRVGPYIVEGKLGEGSFAVVRQGTHMGTSEPVRCPLPACLS